jgi:hypothetical protein
MALFGYFRVCEATRRGGAKRVRPRYNYRMPTVAAVVFAAAVVFLSMRESSAGWEQIGLDGLAPGDGEAWIYFIIGIWAAIAVAALATFYIFVSMGFCELRRTVIYDRWAGERKRARLKKEVKVSRRSEADDRPELRRVK